VEVYWTELYWYFVMGKMLEDGVASMFGRGMRVLGWELIVCTILWEKAGKYS
jgi:hypothetical protein